MLDYFGGVIDTYTIGDALKDPEGPYLTPYEYFPILCDLSEEDFDKWHEDYKKSGWGSEDSTNDKKRQAIFRRMNLVLSSMDSKIKNLEKLCKENYSERKYSLVFSGEGTKEGYERNISRAGKILKSQNWSFSSIVSENNEISQNQKQRIDIIKNFKEANIDAISAIKILDEGIDVPSIRTAYILASSNNRRQFVQRRGRVLRLSDNKSRAKIYDFVINPPKSRRGETGIDKIYENELKRIEELSEDALNRKDIEEFIKSYKL